MSDNSHSRNLDLGVRTSRTFRQVSHRLGIIVQLPVFVRGAIFRLRSAVYFHHGLFDAPSMYRTAAMNVSSTHGSCRWPVIRHRSSYSAYGSRPSNPAGDVIPNWRRSLATAGPTFGMSS